MFFDRMEEFVAKGKCMMPDQGIRGNEEWIDQRN
jgi:hypothetical protein